MKRVRLDKSAPSAYWSKSSKQNLGYGIVDTSDDHANYLIRDGEATLVKDLGRIKGRFAPLKFGDKVMWKPPYKKLFVKAIFLHDSITVATLCSILTEYFAKEDNVIKEDLKRGWK